MPQIDHDSLVPRTRSAGELESVTFTVKLLDCAEVLGVPLIVPEEVASVIAAATFST